MYAKAAIHYISAYAERHWPGRGMECTVPSFTMLDCFDIADVGTHKYIPADRLSADLGLSPGAGVYGYIKFKDGSYILQTCAGRNAYWPGGDAPAEWVDCTP